jgi:aryl-alcohol dehydrogenase-like predicted oxidoreductase
MLTRPIPSTGEPLPMVGCGTWKGFDVDPRSAAQSRLDRVVSALVEAGGAVIDSSPMYGRAEAVVGAALAGTGLRDRIFLATKVWTSGRREGIAQMERSFALFGVTRIDLMQIHNLVDWRTHLPVLREWKAEGRFRHIGLTHYTASAHRELEAVMRAEAVDFVQINYSLEDRAAEARLLPLAQERGVAVLVNVPLGSGRLVEAVRGRPLPDWAGGLGCASWPQLLLKFVLGHPAVTGAIPGTGSPEHMVANAAAAREPLPDARQRAEIAKLWKAVS